MIPRYAPQQIAKIFSDTSRLQRWLDVELLACEGWAETGRIPVEALTELQGATIDAERIAELEAEQGHDMAAFVAAVQETVEVLRGLTAVARDADAEQVAARLARRVGRLREAIDALAAHPADAVGQVSSVELDEPVDGGQG